MYIEDDAAYNDDFAESPTTQSPATRTRAKGTSKPTVTSTVPKRAASEPQKVGRPKRTPLRNLDEEALATVAAEDPVDTPASRKRPASQPKKGGRPKRAPRNLDEKAQEQVATEPPLVPQTNSTQKKVPAKGTRVSTRKKASPKGKLSFFL